MPSTSSTPSVHRSTLEQKLGADIADAIDGRIIELSREEIQAVLTEHKAELGQMITDQRNLVADTKSLPPEQQRELGPTVNAANQKVREATEAANDLVARHNRGEQVEQADMDRAQQQLEDAHRQQAEAYRKVTEAQRASQASEQQTSAPAPSRPATVTPISRTSTQREHGGSTAMPEPGPTQHIGVSSQPATQADITRLQGQIDQVGADAKAAKDMSSRSVAIAKSSSSSGDSAGKAIQAMVFSFLLFFVLYCLVILLTGFTWDSSNAFGIPAIFAAVVAGVVYLMTSKDSSGSQSEESTEDEREAHYQEHQHDEHSSSRRSIVPGLGSGRSR